jgi:hypothetical protein
LSRGWLVVIGAAIALVAAILIVPMACRGSEVERLEDARFFALAGFDAEAVKEQVRADPESGVFAEGTMRFWPADAEDLAEGGAGAFLEGLKPTLRAVGVPPFSLDEEFGETSYFLTVNGRRHVILTEAEAASDHVWGHAAARTVGLLNLLLGEVDARERAYGYLSAETNDFSVFLLTPQQREVVADILGADGPDAPYEVRNEPPGFGYPHWEGAFGTGSE